ncbi:MAG: hypothetical protein LBJ21_10175, partial [Acidobacteriota bacterium]|nr:hypothetical protein [Acidobacteriota bacterium]
LLGYPFRRALPYAIDLRLSALIYVHCRAESPQSIAQGESPVFADKYKIQALKGRNQQSRRI